MKLLLSGLAAVLIVTSPASAQGEPQKKEGKIICKRDPGTELGSNLRRRKKACMTESQWIEADAMNERTKRRIRYRGSGELPKAGGVGVGG
jgi:hypothetical protein